MGRKQAAFWKHAERMGNRFKCKFCKQVFPGGVVRLRSHLSGITGQGIQVCSKVPEDVKSDALIASNNGPIKKKKSKLKTSSSNSDITSPEICDARCSNEVDSFLAKFFEMNDINCSIVESPSFINLVNVLIKSVSGYVLPSCSTLENQLILALRKEVEQYISIARQTWEEIGCTLIFDIWREKEKRSFISIIACSGKRAVLLNTFEIPNNLTASFLEKVVHHVVEYVGPDKVIQYFVDDTQCSEEIAKLLTSKCPHVFTTRCVVRELESFFEEVHQEVEWIRATFETAKCLVDAMYKDGDHLALMRTYTVGKELKQSRGYDMLESIFEVRDDLVKLAQSPEWLASGFNQQENGKKATAIIASEEFWKQGEEILMALKPLFTILHLDDASDSSFGYLYGLIKVAEEVIAHLQTNKQDKYQKLWSIFELKKNRIIHETHKAAAFLNPAYLCNATGQDITRMEEGINYILHKFVADDDREAFVEHAMHYRRTLSDPHELFKTIAAKTSTPCEWWNGFGEKFPILKKHATKILCQPCGSSSYKSGLGAFRANLIKQRGLVPELNDLNVRMNIFLMEKCNADNEEKKKRINFEEFGQQKSTSGSSDAALVEPRHSDDETRLSTTREELPGPEPLKLCFMTVVASPILTDQKVKGYQGCPIHVYLADSATDCAVQDGAPSTLTLTISVLDGDFTNEASSDECRTREYFDRNDLSSDMMPLVTGDLQLTLVQGVGMLGEFSFNYSSRGTRSGKFRLAVKTYTGDCEGIRILEGISNAFVVDDNEVIRTQYPAALEMQLPKDSASLGAIAPVEGWWGPLEHMLGESSSSPGDWNGSIWKYNQLQRSCRSLRQIAARRVKKKALLWRTRSCNLRIKMKRRSLEPIDKEKIGNEAEARGGLTLRKNLNQQEYCKESNVEPLAVLKEIDSSGTELKPIEETFEFLSPKHLSTALELSLTRDEALEPREGAESIISTSGNNANHQKEVNDDQAAGDCVSPKPKISSATVMIFGISVNGTSSGARETQSPSNPSPTLQLVNEVVEPHSISTEGNNVNQQIEPILSGNLPPRFDTSTCRSVYIGNIHPQVNEYLLQEVFTSAGPIEGCKLIRKEKSSYGFVDYFDRRCAALAIVSLNGRHLFGQPIKVNWAYASSQREDTSGHFDIFIGDLSPEVTDATLFACFSAYSSCSDARVMWDRKTGRSRGFGFVSFQNQQDAQSAIDYLNGKWLGSRQIRCNWAEKGASSDGKSVMELTSGTSDDGQERTMDDAPENNPQYKTVYVGNLAPEVTTIDLHRHFYALGAGTIEEVRVQRKKDFGFVRYNSNPEAARAIQMGNAQILCGKPIKCSWASKPTLPCTTSTLPPPTAAPVYPGFSAADLGAYERMTLGRAVGMQAPMHPQVAQHAAALNQAAAGASQAIYDGTYPNVATTQQLMHT